MPRHAGSSAERKKGRRSRMLNLKREQQQMRGSSSSGKASSMLPAVRPHYNYDVQQSTEHDIAVIRDSVLGALAALDGR